MNHSYPYIASLTREPFLFYEMRSTAKLMSEGLLKKRLQKKLSGRIFSSIRRRSRLPEWQKPVSNGFMRWKMIHW